MAGNIKQFLLNEQLGFELASGIATFYICNPSCKELPTGNDEVDHHITIAIWMASSALILFVAIIALFIIYKYVMYAVYYT